MEQNTFIAIPQEQFESLNSSIQYLSEQIKELHEGAQSDWLSEERYCKAMDISKSTLRRIMYNNLIEGLTLRTQKLGRKTYIHKQELNRVFEIQDR
jgi:hypothetical protein